MKTKKTLAILLAVMMILSAFPVVSLAAVKPTVTEWPTLITTYFEVGMPYSEVEFTGGSASVPGYFTTASSGTLITPSDATSVRFRFIPEDTETYSNVTTTTAEAPKVVVNPCSNPRLEGELTAKTILKGTAIGTSVLALGEETKVYARAVAITSRVDTITFDNPDKVYNEAGTYEEPVTITFKKTNKGLSYAVDLKATAKITVADKLDSEIITLPTLESNGIPDSKKASDLVFVGGEASVPGKFSATNPDQELVVGDNIVNLTFTPDDLTKYLPTTADATFKLTGKLQIPENVVLTVPYARNKYVSSVYGTAESFGVDIVPSSASISCNTSANSNAINNTKLKVGDEIKCKAIVNLSGYARETIDVTIKVVPGKYTSSPATASLKESKLQNDGSYLLTVGYGAYYAAPEFNGNVIVRVNGEKVGEAPIKTSPESYTYVATKSGEYVVTAEYVPHEDDCWYFEDTSLLVSSSTPAAYEIIMPREVETDNCRVSHIENETENGNALPGAKVTVLVRAFETFEKFDGWTFYDDEGNEFVPEGLQEDYMTTHQISFTMPNHDVKVKATFSLNLGGDDDEDEPGTDEPGTDVPGTDEPGTDEPGTDEPGTDEPGIEIPDIELPDLDIDWDELTDGSHSLKIVNIFKNIVEMIKDFIQQIGDFFGSINIKDLGGIIG